LASLELKVPAFSCKVDDLIVMIRPFHFFNTLQPDSKSEPNTVHSHVPYLHKSGFG